MGGNVDRFVSHDASRLESGIVSVSTPFFDDKTQANLGNKIVSLIDMRLNQVNSAAKDVWLLVMEIQAHLAISAIML